jgi:Tol biopolymer transport system component/beta-lactamase regulating signal transducer with metallopeptidase domain
MATLNDIAIAWWQWMGSMLWQVSLLIVIIGILDVLLRRWIWPQVRYALWLLILVKLILPPSWSLPSSLVSQTRPQLEQLLLHKIIGTEFYSEMMKRHLTLSNSPLETTQDNPNNLLTESQEPMATGVIENSKTAVNWQIYAFSIWVLGMLVFVGLILFKSRKLHQWHQPPQKNALPPWFENLLKQTAAQFKLKKLPEVIFSSQTKTPAVYGLFHPVLLLPVNFFENLTQVEAQHVLLHELAHLKRKDLWTNGLCLVVQIIYWFNPLILWVRQQLKHIREMCCDLTVANVIKEDTMVYRQTLLNTARQLLTKKVEPGLGLMGIFEESFRIVNRLKWLEKRTWKTHRVALVSSGFIFIAMFAFILPMANAKVNQKSIFSYELQQIADTNQAKGIMLRKIWTGSSDIGEGEISPDGRYTSVADWVSGDLAILNNETGEFRRITDKGSWEVSNEFVWFSRWSPDGKQLVYDWWDENSSEIRIIDITTLEHKTLYQSNNNVVWTEVHDWSPDGKSILAVFYTDQGKRQLVLLFLENEEPPAILFEKDGKPGNPGNFSFSPDGRFILYDDPANDSTKNHDIYIFSMDSGQNLPIVEHPAHDYALGWIPDSNYILFASDQSGYFDCWALRISNAEAKSEPQLIKKNIGAITSKNFTRDGSFYFDYCKQLSEIYLTQLDQSTGDVLEPPSIFIKKDEGYNRHPQYSPSGKYLVYTSPTQNVFNNDPTIICIYNLDSGEEQEVHINLTRVTFPYWSPGENYILFMGHDNQNKNNIYRLDIRTGNILLILKQEEGSDIEHVRWAKNGKEIYYVQRNSNNSISQIIVYNLQDKIKKELYHRSSYDISDLQVSPDGNWFAFINRGAHRSVQVLPVTGGKLQELFSFEQSGNHYIPIAWSADGQYIYFARWPDKERNWELWRVSLKQKEAQKLDLEFSPFLQMSFHPDGQYLIFEGPSTPRQKAEIWVMENYLNK